MKPNFTSCAEIDIDKLNFNLDLISNTAKVPLAPVIKANAYGHGAIYIAKELRKRGDVEALCVGTVAEGMELRKAGVGGRIVVLDGVLPGQAGSVIANNLEVVISSLEIAKTLSAKAKRVKIHIKVNSGMRRLGADLDEAVELYKEVARLKRAQIVGVMTHFADSPRKRGYARTQISEFNDYLSAIRACGYSLPVTHAANTAGIFIHPESRMDMVRPGIGIYGACELGDGSSKLKPILSFKARISLIRDLEKGEGVSYDHTWISPGKRRAAVVYAGYADGYIRALSNKGRAIINGKIIKQIGVICMDNCLFDVSSANAKVGDEVTLIGEDGGKKVSAVALAKLANTISYEIICAIGRRVPRIYIKSGKIKKIVEGI